MLLLFLQVSNLSVKFETNSIASKIDLREDKETAERLAKKGLQFVSYEMGLAMANQIGALEFTE